MRDIRLQPAVKRFFISFARFEYALKRAGYVKRRGRGWAAEVDWMEFSRRNSDAYGAMVHSEGDNKLAKAVQFITKDPPRQLVLHERNGNQQLYWKKTGPKGSSLEDLLVLVRRVRNNLFHGEKPETIVGGTPRGIKLIENSQEVISACVTLDGNVQRYFEDYAPSLPRLDDGG